MSSDEVLAARLRMAVAFWHGQHIYGGALIMLQLVMCVQCLNAYLAMSPERRRTRRLYIIATFVICILDSTMRFGYMKYDFAVLTSRVSVEETFDMMAATSNVWYKLLSEWTGMFVVLLGDALLVYRCYVVWTGQIIAVIIPALSFSAYAIYNIYSSIVSSANIEASVTEAAIYANVAMIVITNCSVTLLIGWRLLRMRRRQGAILENYDGGVHLRAISIVAEAALPLSISVIFVAICYGKTYRYPSHWRQWSTASKISSALYDVCAVLSPQIIIWRVILGRSFAHTNMKTTFVSTLAFHRNEGNAHSSDSDFDLTESKAGLEASEHDSEKEALPIV